MRRLPLLALLGLLPLVATAGLTSEVLVGMTPTPLPFSPTRKGLLIENRGPNPIWCAMSATAAVVGRSHKIDVPGGTESNRFPFNAADAWWCVAEGAPQMAGAATIVSEVP